MIARAGRWMGAPFSACLLVLLCASLSACSLALSRGADPRDSTGANGSTSGASAPGAVGLFATPMLFDWLKAKLMPNKHEDVPPPPPPSAGSTDARRFLEQDCTDPAKHPDPELRCR